MFGVRTDFGKDPDEGQGTVVDRVGESVNDLRGFRTVEYLIGAVERGLEGRLVPRADDRVDLPRTRVVVLPLHGLRRSRRPARFSFAAPSWDRAPVRLRQ